MDSAIGMLKSWFVASALPYWAEHAADHAHGGFYEMIDLSGSPVASPRRARLVARRSMSSRRPSAAAGSIPAPASSRTAWTT